MVCAKVSMTFACAHPWNFNKAQSLSIKVTMKSKLTILMFYEIEFKTTSPSSHNIWDRSVILITLRYYNVFYFVFICILSSFSYVCIVFIHII